MIKHSAGLLGPTTKRRIKDENNENRDPTVDSAVEKKESVWLQGHILTMKKIRQEHSRGDTPVSCFVTKIIERQEEDNEDMNRVCDK